MNNNTCATNSFGNNSLWIIILILFFMPNLFGGCGCNGGSDLFILIIVLLLFTGCGNNLFCCG